jgi:DNA mismatch endonuclease, patch repair protein
MRRVKGKDTAPERAVRAIVRSLGVHFTLNRGDLPGKPDVVFLRRRKVIFVHGCFWHGHICRAGRNRPSSSEAYWIPKLERNRKRDGRNRRLLWKLGWSVLTVWECQLRAPERLRGRIERFLARPRSPSSGPA